MKRKEITKEWLQSRGITNVTEDGQIYFGEKMRKWSKVTCKHKYGTDKSYPVIHIYDPDCFQAQKKRKCKTCPGVIAILVSRVVYAWFNNVCPADLDVDHKDNDPFNNNIDNLQLLTRKENLAKRLPRNQFTADWTEADLAEHLKKKEKFNLDCGRIREYIDKCKRDIDYKERERKDFIQLRKQMPDNKLIKRCVNASTRELEELKVKLKGFRAELKRIRVYYYGE